jgi:hypothetical protein
MKFLVRNYSCLQNLCLGGYRPQIPVLSVLCLQLNLLNPLPPPKKNSWIRHSLYVYIYDVYEELKDVAKNTGVSVSVEKQMRWYKRGKQEK